tara:strand:- start:2937 stop:3986 length:1050 start_codon:yes stop_codon:yes gene_type:complete
MPESTVLRAKAPLRISFSGGGTEIEPFLSEEGGCVLTSTINSYAHGSFVSRNDGTIRVHSVDYDIVESFSAYSKLEYDGSLDLFKGVINQVVGKDNKGMNIFLETGVPPGSGLGASSAVVVCLVGLLREAYNLSIDQYQISELAYKIEREELGIHGGMQDQYAACFGGINFIEFSAEGVVVNPLRVRTEIINELEHNLLLCHTGKSRASSHIIEHQVSNYEDKNKRNTLRNMKIITQEMKVALLKGDLQEFSYLLGQEWESKKSLSNRISNDSIDEIYDICLKAGAIAGKISGAGGGGYLLLYCPFEKKHIVTRELQDNNIKIRPFSFTSEGLEIWRPLMNSGVKNGRD